MQVEQLAKRKSYIHKPHPPKNSCMKRLRINASHTHHRFTNGIDVYEVYAILILKCMHVYGILVVLV